MKYIIQLFFCSLYWLQLNAQGEVTRYQNYDFSKPVRAVALPEELDEISGLSLSSDGNTLFAIADEEGVLYQINPLTGDIIASYPFWKEGDYEGVEQVGEVVYVVKSSGTVYAITDVGTDTQEVTKYNDFLEKENDVEGLGYCPITGQLLLACKAQPGEGLDETRNKAIYGFDLRGGRLISQPRVIMQRDSVESYLKRCTPSEGFHKICRIFDSEEESFKLNTAALAVHPITGNYYLTSSKGQLLGVMTPNGQVLFLTKLPKDLHPQPEGLAFDNAGNLFVANESRDEQPAMLYYYVLSAGSAASR